ncbi:unnamed protein product [Umbelopsis ramanniana]
MITAEPEVDHRHLNLPSVKGAATHYTDGEDEPSHEVSSMFARAFEKIENLFRSNSNGFMTVYQMKQCHDDFYLQGGDTQSKTTVSIDRISAAASCEAWYSYERHATLEKFDGDKQKSLDYTIGFAMAEAIKLFEQLNNRHATTEEREHIASSAGAHAKAYFEANYT